MTRAKKFMRRNRLVPQRIEGQVAEVPMRVTRAAGIRGEDIRAEEERVFPLDGEESGQAPWEVDGRAAGLWARAVAFHRVEG